MSFLTAGFSVESVLPIANNVIGAAAQSSRPLIGLGVFAALVVVFKPLLSGLVRAGILAVSPAQSLDERRLQERVKDRMAMDRMARDLEAQHPGLAAELRSIALRD